MKVETTRKNDQHGYNEDQSIKGGHTRREGDDLPGYKNDHKHYKKSYKKSDGGFNQKMDQEDLKTYTAAFVITHNHVGPKPNQPD
ncbi:hypothetical protein Tco_0581555 [Tanacetum coccineum]